jgi:hypothetical protein
MDIQKFISNGVGPSSPIQRTSFFTCQIDMSQFRPLWGNEYTQDIDATQSVLQQGLICTGVSLPSREFQTTDINIYGVEEKYPILSTFVDLNCEFLTPLFRHNGTWRNSIAATFHHWQDAMQPMTTVAPFGERSFESESIPEITNLNFKFPNTYRLSMGFTIAQYTPQQQPDLTSASSSQSLNRISSSLKDIAGPIYRADVPPTFRSETVGSSTPYVPTIVYHFYNVYPVSVQSTQLDWSDSDQIQRLRVSFAYTHWTTRKPSKADASFLNQLNTVNNLPVTATYTSLTPPPTVVVDEE